MALQGLTSHGHPIPGLVQEKVNHVEPTQCGGPGNCATCDIEVCAAHREAGIWIEEPKHRNDVVLLTNGAIARRNTDGDGSTSHGPWTWYPAEPLPERLYAGAGAVDPGHTTHWVAIRRNVVRVLHRRKG